MKDMQQLTQKDVERLRGELFFIILFAIAWALIGEYLLNFSDYYLGAGLTLLVAVCLALYSIKLYNLEDGLKAGTLPEGEQLESKQYRSYAFIFGFEVLAILVTWALLLKFGHDNWLVYCFALIAGLHFFPLARLMRQNSFYLLGIWICILAIASYLLASSGKMTYNASQVLVAYGCAGGAAMDGAWIVVRSRKDLRQ